MDANRAAFAERETDERNAATYRAYTARANGVIVETRYESVTAESPRARVAVSYLPAGGRRMETWITVHMGFWPFSEGEAFEVAYDPAHPERAASGKEADLLARDPRGLERLIGEGGGRGPAPSFRPAQITGALAGAALLITTLWTTLSLRRNPR